MQQNVISFCFEENSNYFNPPERQTHSIYTSVLHIKRQDTSKDMCAF